MNESKKLVSMDKKYKTRDGQGVRLLCVDARSPNFPVVALVEGCRPETFTRYGNHDVGYDSPLDLIEQPEEKTVWVEIYRYKYWTSESSDQSCIHYSLADLETSINPKFRSKDYQLVAIKKVVYKGGDRE